MGIEQEEERGGFKDKGVYKLKIGHVGVDSELVGDNDMGKMVKAQAIRLPY